MIRRLSNQSLWTDLIFLLISALLSYYFVSLRLYTAHYYYAADPFALVKGIAYTPFQFRALIPWIARGLTELKLPLSLTFILIDLASTFLLCMALRYYLSFFLKDRRLNAILSLSLFYVLPFTFLRPNLYTCTNWYPLVQFTSLQEIRFPCTNWYPWDIASILFFTLGLAYIFKQNWKWYYPLFVVATFNRETTLFLMLVYIFTALGTKPQREIFFHTVLQLLIWGSIKVFLYWLYAHNPTVGYGLFELQIYKNIHKLILPPSFLLVFLSTWGLIWLPVVIWYRHIPSVFVKRTLWVLPALFLSIGLFGNIHEIRLSAEGIPIILTAFLLILRELFKTTESTSVDKGLTKKKRA
jgi:hypothetical protein